MLLVYAWAMPRIPSEVTKHFAQVPLFSRVSKGGLRLLVSEADELDVPAGKDLVREGEYGRHLYVIVSGTARVHRKGRRIASLGPGDFFGEMALLTRTQRTATVTSQTDMRLMMLSSGDLASVLRREPTVATAVMTVMADRIRQDERAGVV